MNIALLCGGQSLERGISLNSARCVLDHLALLDVSVTPFFQTLSGSWVQLTHAHLYSNTPQDFDYKLGDLPPISLDSLSEFDLVFSTLHGPYGEDGGLQSDLESRNIPFVGSSSASCKRLFHKFNAAQELHSAGFKTIPSALLTPADFGPQINTFVAEQGGGHLLLKPISWGSSFGIHIAPDSSSAHTYAEQFFAEHPHEQLIIEPFVSGREFSVLVLESPAGQPVALLPTEIDFDRSVPDIYSYRKKYLATNECAHHTPPRWDLAITQKIQAQAEKIFDLFEMSDFARLDGWLLDSGDILFSDLNPISGLEQNSMLFRQSSLLGLTHAETLLQILTSAARRHHLAPPLLKTLPQDRQPVHVLFGGPTAERQVSLLSGSNAWLKLRNSSHCAPEPFLLDPNHDVWHLPYTTALNHTVEEVFANCVNPPSIPHVTLNELRDRLGFAPTDFPVPQKLSLDEFIQNAADTEAFVFLGLHGGIGEDGTLQTRLAAVNISFNGPSARASEVCMDKALTADVINAAQHCQIRALPKYILNFSTLSLNADFVSLWETISLQLNSADCIIKPRSEGCSSGVLRIDSADDFQTYCEHILAGKHTLAPNTLAHQPELVELPGPGVMDFILEPTIIVDPIAIKNGEIQYTCETGWLEFTAGIVERQGRMQSLSPSISVADNAILSLEEKFQGGTGINLTPPPASILPASQLEELKHLLEESANILGLENYSRIDCFYNLKTRDFVLIEVNTLPALTPSTVLFQQAIQEGYAPTELLERLIEDAQKKRRETTAL